MTINFNWTAEKDDWAGTDRFVMRSPELPKGSMSPLCADDRLAVCSREAPRKWVATFWIGYDSIKAEAGTYAKAIRDLQKILTAEASDIFDTTELSFAAI